MVGVQVVMGYRGGRGPGGGDLGVVWVDWWDF